MIAAFNRKQPTERANSQGKPWLWRSRRDQTSRPPPTTTKDAERPKIQISWACRKAWMGAKAPANSAMPDVAPDTAAAIIASAGKPQHSACRPTTAA